MPLLDIPAKTLRDHPARLRAAVAATLVLAGRAVPEAAGLTACPLVVDLVTALAVLVLGESAARKVAAKRDPR